MSHNAQNTDTHIDEALTGRYAPSIGWDPHQKPARSKGTDREIEAARKKARDQYREREALRSAIEVKPARQMLHDAPRPKQRERRPLFPPFWHQGELAVLLAPPNDDASILAVQIAETLAAGPHAARVQPSPLVKNTTRSTNNTNSPPYEGGVDSEAGNSGFGRRGGSLGTTDQAKQLSTLNSPLSTLLIDLHRTPRQYRERYTAGKKRYRFSKHLEFGFIAATEIPDAYKGQTEKFLRKAIGAKLAETDADVIIIDNLSWLTRSTGNSPELRSFLRSLRRYTNHTAKSVLLLAENSEFETRPSSRLRGSPLFTVHRSLFTHADSIFQLSNSTFSPDHRYVKAIKTSLRMESGQLKMGNASEDSQFSILNSQLTSPVHVFRIQHGPTAHSSLPTAYHYEGLAEEHTHTHDYAADIRKLEAALQTTAAKQEQKRQRLIRRSAKEAIAEGFLDGSYTNYLLGP